MVVSREGIAPDTSKLISRKPRRATPALRPDQVKPMRPTGGEVGQVRSVLSCRVANGHRRAEKRTLSRRRSEQLASGALIMAVWWLKGGPPVSSGRGPTFAGARTPALRRMQ